MAVYAIVRDSDGLIENLIVWDGTTPWSPAADRSAVLDASREGKMDGWYTVGAGFNDPMPQITGIDPVSGSTAGGTTVTIQGHNLDLTDVVVKFDGVAATNIQNQTKTSLQCDTPAHAAESVDVTVECGAGSWTNHDTLAGGFEYTA